MLMQREQMVCSPTYPFPCCWWDGLLSPNERMPLSLYHPQAALCYPDIKKQVLPLPISLKGRTLHDLIDGGSGSIYNPPIFWCLVSPAHYDGHLGKFGEMSDAVLGCEIWLKALTVWSEFPASWVASPWVTYSVSCYVPLPAPWLVSSLPPGATWVPFGEFDRLIVQLQR